MKEMKPEISVVIPTIEEESLFKLVPIIRKKLGKNVEIIIVDKSSGRYFKRLQQLHAVLLSQKSKGVERAIMMGLSKAHGEILASIDADMTHDPQGLVDAIRMVKQEKADLVLGNRMAHLEEGSMSGYLRFGNSMLSWMFSRLYKTRVHDVMTGVFAMRREAFESMKDEDPYRAGIAFFAIELASRGYKIGEVDINYYIRRQGTSKLTRSKLIYGANVASHLIRKIRDYNPLFIFGGIGIIIFIIGIVLGLNVLVNFFYTGRFTETGRALVAFMLVVIGFLFGIGGLILDLLVEIEGRLRKR